MLNDAADRLQPKKCAFGGDAEATTIPVGYEPVLGKLSRWLRREVQAQAPCGLRSSTPNLLFPIFDQFIQIADFVLG